MVSVITKINILIDQHDNSFTKCNDPKCEICQEVKRLGDKLWGERWKEPNRIGDKMTKELYMKYKKMGYSENKMAKEFGVTRTAIRLWRLKHLEGKETK